MCYIIYAKTMIKLYESFFMNDNAVEVNLQTQVETMTLSQW